MSDQISTATATSTGTKNRTTVTTKGTSMPTTTTATSRVLPLPISSNGTNKPVGDSDPTKPYPSPAAQYDEVVQNAEMFMQTLQDLHRFMGTKFMVPTMGGKALDLHRLFVEVTSRGGLEKVIRDRKWRDVIAVFGFPATITNASFVLRKYYISLLHHYEQVYYFHRHCPSTSMAVSVAKNPACLPANLEVQANVPPHENGITVNQSAGSPRLNVGCQVSGIIDGKFDNGYLVTVSFGSDKLRGVLYHVPDELQVPGNSNTPTVSGRQNRKRSQIALKDPSRPKTNRSGYNFFFAEQYARLKPSHQGEEKVISKKIGHLWSKLTEDEKQSVNVIWSFTQEGRAEVPSMTSAGNIQKSLSGERTEGQGEIPE
ncbi:high mobility group B protein 10-like isoform X2 [Macadamia integrifolia]|uniref:high mobility group B protein 10-like isoform X2 n=1 Tax=Macadamia integrifolia TaxID=60698 RepID=UPI001C53286B|nr:high mobility group B protein 10-like isoform X2 [Macadamia integrifolia]